jgi:hypothetical protein
VVHWLILPPPCSIIYKLDHDGRGSEFRLEFLRVFAATWVGSLKLTVLAIGADLSPSTINLTHWYVRDLKLVIGFITA